MTSRVWSLLTLAMLATAVGVLQGEEAVTARFSPEEALLMRGNWDCNTPLVTWVKLLRHRCRIPIFIDEIKLQDAGIGSDTPVALQLGEVPLLVALPHVLEPLGLGFMVENGVLVISTQEELDLRLSTRVFSVKDLVPGDDWGDLMMAIQESGSAMWEQVDGEGGTMTPVRSIGVLVIHQTWKSHCEIRSLLSALRKSQGLPDVPSICASPFANDNFNALPLVPVSVRDEGAADGKPAEAPAQTKDAPRQPDDDVKP